MLLKTTKTEQEAFKRYKFVVSMSPLKIHYITVTRVFVVTLGIDTMNNRSKESQKAAIRYA